jgi:hypothetical protein
LLADRGAPEAALALLMQMEERCREWFTLPAEEEEALASVTMMELLVLRSWFDALSPTDHAAERTWCAERATKLIQDRLTGEERAMMRLSPVVPMLVPPPKIGDVEP